MDREQSWRLLAETTGDIVVEVSPDLTVRWASPRFVAALGRAPEESVGLGIAERVHPDDQEAATDAIRRALAGESAEVECRLASSAGWRWFQCHGRAFAAEDGPRVLVVARDVSRRRALKDALLAREQKFRLLAENSNDVIWALDLDLGAWYVSPSVERHLGWTADEYAAMGLDERMPPEAFRKAAELYRLELPRARELAKEGRHHSFRFEAQHRHKDGSLVWGDIVVSFVCDGDWNVVGIQGITRNIEERKRMEHALARSEERFRRLFERMFSGVALLEPWPGGGAPDFRLVEANPAWDLQTGVHGPAALGRRLSEVLPDLVPDFPTLDEVARTGAPLRFERHAPQLDRWLDVLAFVPADGQVALVLGDVTQRRVSDEARAKSQRLESIGVLAGGIAHDFNNLLTGILGNVTLSRMVLEDEHRADAMLDAAEEACRRARDLTLHLLTFSKGGEPVRGDVDLEEVVRDAAERAREGSRTTVAIRVAPAVARIRADGGQIGLVVHNLVLNAVQAMGGAGCVDVAADLVDFTDLEPPPCGSGPCVRIQVRDQGPGIAADVAEHVFEPYFTTREGGSGLGLAVAYSIVRRHGGTILFDPGPGRGAVFTVWLPGSDACGAGTAPATEGGPANASPEAPRGRVLVLDDNPVVREVLVRMLSAVGFGARCVSDGNAAVAAWQEARAEGHPFDAALMDLTIPHGMGGREAMEAIRALDPEARGVVMSGYNSDPVMARHAEHGFAGVLPKPVDLDELARVLGQVIGTGPAAEAGH